MKQLQRIIAARTALVLDEPFFGPLAMKLKLREDSIGCGTFATDGRELIFNEAFAEPLSFDQLKGVICHEVMHVAQGHPWRRDGREFEDYNIACDYSIDPIIVNAGFKLPDGEHVDQRYTGKSAEWIYAEIQKSKRQSNGEDSVPSKQGGGSGPAQQPPKQDAQQPDPQQAQQPSAPDQPEPQPEPKPYTGFGEVRDCKGEDAEAEEQEWQQAVFQAAIDAESQGKLPGGMDRLIDKIKNPCVDWKGAMRKFVQQCAKNDFSWRQPNRRYLAHGMYLPSLHSENMPPIMITIDTSGSIDAEQLKVFAAEITEIMAECKPERIHVLYIDSKVQRVDEFEAGDQITFQAKGGGGTDMPEGWRWAEDNQVEPACAIVFTDMETPFGVEPPYPVLWATTSRTQAPYGETLRLEAA